MNLRELLLLGLVGWTLIGVVGVLVARVRHRRGVPGERKRVVRGIGWLVGVWVVYFAVLVGVSLGQPQRVAALGQAKATEGTRE